MNEQEINSNKQLENNQLVVGLYTKINMLEGELKEGKRLSRVLLDKLNEVFKNGQYLNAFILYQSHFGDYLKNGGIQIVDEQENLEKWVSEK